MAGTRGARAAKGGWVFVVLLGVLAMGLGFILGCGGSRPKTAVYKNSTYGISFSYPGSWKLETAPNRTSQGLKGIVAVDGGRVGDVAVGMLDASGQRDPRSLLLQTVRSQVKTSESAGDKVSDPTFEYVDSHPAYGWATAYPDRVGYSLFIAAKPYCFVLLGDIWPGHQSEYLAALKTLVTTMRFSGPSAAWSVDPSRWNTYLDREASYSLRYPDSYLAVNDASKGQGGVMFMRADSSAIIGTDALAAGILRVVPVGFPRELSKGEAERFLTTLTNRRTSTTFSSASGIHRRARRTSRSRRPVQPGSTRCPLQPSGSRSSRPEGPKTRWSATLR